MKQGRKYATILLLLGFILTWILLLTKYNPRELVDLLGTERTIISLFLIGAFGGLSFFTSASYYTALATFSAGGINPFLLGLAGGLGLSIGDSLYFLLGRNSKMVMPDIIQRWSRKASAWIAGLHPSAIPAGVLFYASFIPLPNDVLMVTLALTDVEYQKILVPVVIGNIILTTIIALTAGAIFL